jgi:hypothetical protein
MKARIRERQHQPSYIPDGKIVKLNYDHIVNHPQYPKMVSKYKAWVEENKDTLFTTFFNPDDSRRPDLINLKKDGIKQIWVFFYADLIVQDVPVCAKCKLEPRVEGKKICVVCDRKANEKKEQAEFEVKLQEELDKIAEE